MTRYSKLLDSGQIEQGRFSIEQVADRLNIARRDLEAAAHMLGPAHEWAYAIAYNAMLQAGRALMFAEGFRAKGEGQHFIVVQFLRAGLGPDWWRVRSCLWIRVWWTLTLPENPSWTLTP